MADLISFETIIDNLQTGLNTLSNTLSTANRIDSNLQFNIEEHTQDSEADKKYSTGATIDGIAIRIGGTFNPSQQYAGYQERITVTFDAFTRDKNDMDLILNEYATQNSGALTKTSEWVYFASFEKPQFVDRNVDSGEQRVSVYFDVIYSFVFRGILADDILLKINTVEVPVLSYASKIEKEGVTGDTLTDAGVKKAQFTKATTSKYMKFIHINNAQLNSMLQDIDTGSYLNREYTVFYGVACDENGLNCLYNSTTTMKLSSGSVEFAEGQFQTIEGTFLPSKGL
jgi:hypothetical protein